MRFPSARNFIVAASIVLAGIIACGAPAQSSNRGMMAINDGNGEHVMSFAEPNIELITRPFINRRDLPLFVDYLELSDAQRVAVERLIDKYLEDYKILLRDKHPQPEGENGLFGRRRAPQVAVQPGVEQGEDEDEPIAEPAIALGNNRDSQPAGDDNPMSSIDSILLDEIRKEGIDVSSLDDLPVQPMIGIAISMGGPEEGEPADAAPEPEVSVSIGFQSEDDSLDEGLRAKLEAAAKRAVPRMAEAVKQRELVQLAEGDGPHDGLPPGEELEKRYAELEALRARVDEFLKAKKALLNSFYASVKKLLSEQQFVRWPALERALTRVKTLPWGELDGESVDLIAVAREVSLSDDERAAIASVLDEYELRLHEALERRNLLLETADAEIDRALHDRQFERAMSAADRLARSRVAVRDLNDRTTETLRAAIEGRSSKRLRSAILAEAYPRIWRQTIGQQAFDKAILLEELDPEVQTLVLEQAGTHAQLMAELNDRLWQSVRREQANRLKMELESTVARYKGEETEPLNKTMADIRRSIRDAFQERQDLDVRSMKNLYASLPAESVAKLPDIPKHDVGAPVRADHQEGGARIIVVDDED